MTGPPTLLVLAQEATAAVNRALAAKADDHEQKEFVRLTDTVEAHRDRLALARFVLQTPELAVTDEERRGAEEALRTLQESVARVRTAVAADPSVLRRGTAWKSLDTAATTATRVLRDVQEAAVGRIVSSQPRPKAGVTVALPPGSPLGADYRKLSEQYEQRVDRIETAIDLQVLLKICSQIAELEAEIESQAVPADHVDGWRRLLAGRMTLGDVTPAFAGWLSEAGHSASIVLRYDAHG